MPFCAKSPEIFGDRPRGGARIVDTEWKKSLCPGKPPPFAIEGIPCRHGVLLSVQASSSLSTEYCLVFPRVDHGNNVRHLRKISAGLRPAVYFVFYNFSRVHYTPARGNGSLFENAFARCVKRRGFQSKQEANEAGKEPKVRAIRTPSDRLQPALSN